MHMTTESTRTRIINTAMESFWRTSYQATNMNDLSRAAGVNKATLYQYFSSKEEMALAAVSEAAQRSRSNVFERAFAQHDDALERLIAIYQNVYEMHLSIYEKDGVCCGCPLINIGVELGTANEVVRNAVSAVMESFLPFYERIIEQLRNDGRLSRTDSTQVLAVDLQANMNATQVASKLEKRPEAILDGGDRAVRFLTH